MRSRARVERERATIGGDCFVVAAELGEHEPRVVVEFRFFRPQRRARSSSGHASVASAALVGDHAEIMQRQR